jgi:ABC-type sugar transport system substrate-binding protein
MAKAQELPWRELIVLIDRRRGKPDEQRQGVRPAVPLLLVAALALTAAACGSSGSSSSSASSSSSGGASTSSTASTSSSSSSPSVQYGYAGSAQDTATAKADGAKAAAAHAAAPSGKSIGVIELSGTSAESIDIVAAARRIGAMFGYSVNVCDPNFDPQKIPQCATSIVAQKPSVIFSVSTNPGPLGSGFRQAVSQGIPWFGVVSSPTPAPGMYDYGNNGIALSKLLDPYVFRLMAQKNPGVSPLEVFAIDAPTVGLASFNEGTQLVADAKANSKIQLVKHDLDLANAVQDTLSTSHQTLVQNPKLAGMWTLCDFCLPLMAQSVQNVEGHSRHTVVAGMYSNPQSVADVRTGTVDAVADYPWAFSVWAAMDQTLQHWAHGSKITPSLASLLPSYGLPFFQPYIITKSNASTGPIPVYGPDFESYFTAKWSKEFGVK